ncbi:MAG: hypothetical protein QNJ31_04550 [Candidatus Caenarcaniphilales bacterium]|nr:hypothetical protein [Candidatus Caenarcaniphilales bacterium]
MAKYNLDSKKLFIELVSLQQPEMVAIGGYAAFAGLLYLLTPLAVEEIVNVIAFGVFSQPLISLTIVLMVGYLIAGSMRIAQEYAAELVQQRLFTHFAFVFANKLQKIPKEKFSLRYLSFFLRFQAYKRVILS